MTPLGTLVSVIDDLARAWPVASQQQSRRNAMIACTALAQRRAEREDVDDYFEAAEAGNAERPADAVRTAHG
jgi:hypothetical protein